MAVSRIQSGHVIDSPDSSQGAQMQHTPRSSLYASIAALILTAAAISAAAAPPQQRVPFKGTFQGYDAVTSGSSATTIVVTTTATGSGTLVGQFSFREEVTADLTNGT